MFMPVGKMPQYEMYWNNETRYKPIASIIPLKRYEKVREFSQVVDNSEKVKPENKSDKFFKVRTLFEAVRANCKKIEPEANHSLDEQIIPAKTKTNGGICQNNLKKSHKDGFKNLVRAGQYGIIYKFYLYGGKNSTGGNSYAVLILLY